MSATSVIRAMQEAEEWRATAHGCLSCGVVVTGLRRVPNDEPCPKCHEALGGVLEPLVPVSLVLTMLQESVS